MARIKRCNYFIKENLVLKDNIINVLDYEVMDKKRVALL